MTLQPPPSLSAGASPWEGPCVRRFEPRAQAWARRVRGLETSGLTVDDAAQQLLISVAMACRVWARQSPACPDEPYLWWALHCARKKLYRTIRRNRLVLGVEGDDEVAQAVCTAPLPDAHVGALATEAGYAAALSEVYRALSPDEAHLLVLSADMPPREIAQIVHLDVPPGTSPNVYVAQRLYAIRRKAREHLRHLGIAHVEDVHRATATLATA